MVISNKPRRLFVLVIFAALFNTLSFTATAQRFEVNLLTGPGRLAEQGEWGVREVSAAAGGGYIAVGTSNVVTAFGPKHDVLVVRLATNGTLIWARTYDLIPSWDDRGACIIECFTGPVGEFAICGDGGSNPGWYIPFVMRINAAGNVIWARTFTPWQTARANRLIETRLGSGVTSPGDLVFCGEHGMNFMANGNFPLLARLTGAGTLIWNQWYVAGAGTDTSYFTDVIECQQGANAGDIAAVGRIWGRYGVIRVNGNTGTIGGAPQGLALWPANSVQLTTLLEVQDPSNGIQGDLVVAGKTLSSTADLYVARLAPNPCTMRLDRAHGDQSTNTEGWAYDIKEILSTPPSTLINGDLILTGPHTVAASSNMDALMAQIDPVFLNLRLNGAGGAGYNRYDNGTNLDWAFSVSPIYATAAPLPTDGFIMCGTTGGNQMYIIKTNRLGSSGPACDEGQVSVSRWTPGYALSCTLTATQSVLTQNTAAPPPVNQSGVNSICYTNPKLVLPTMSDAKLMLSSSPNPVRSGAMVTLVCVSANNLLATIAITDVNGRTIERFTRALAAGENNIELNTTGWASGNYVITLTAGQLTRNERIVVVD